MVRGVRQVLPAPTEYLTMKDQRNSKGKFIKGHIPLNKDSSLRGSSGKFVKSKTDEEKRLRHNKLCKEWDTLHPEYKRNYALKNKNKLDIIRKKHHYIRRYGITFEYKTELIKQQDGRCPICDIKIDESFGQVDHCHETGEIRGILCRPCNTALGSFKEDCKILENAIKYLKGGDKK